MTCTAENQCDTCRLVATIPGDSPIAYLDFDEHGTLIAITEEGARIVIDRELGARLN